MRRSNITSLLCGCALAVLAGASASAADQGGAQVEEVVVTAQQRSESISQVPISVQAISAQQIAKVGGVDTMVLLRLNPSLNFKGLTSVNATGFSIRGVGLVGTSVGVQPSVSLVIDGVPAYRQGEFISDLVDVERIEVLSGPQGTLFGKNASAGVINVVFRRPTDRKELTVETGATTDGEYLARVMANTALAPGLNLRINAFTRDQQPIVKNVGSGPDMDGIRTFGGSVKLAAEMSPDVQWLFSGSYAHSNSSYNSSVIMLPLSSAVGTLQRTLLPLQFGYGQDKTANDLAVVDKTQMYSAVLEGDIQLSRDLKLTSLTGYRELRDDNQGDIDDTPFGGEIGVGLRPNPSNYPFVTYGIGFPRFKEVDKYYSQELRLNYDTDRLSAVGGLFYQAVNARMPLSVTNIFVGGAANWGEVNWRIRDTTKGVFGDVRYDFGAGVSVFGGLRYTSESIKVDYRRPTYSFSPTNPAQFNLLTGAVLVGPSSTVAFSDSRADSAWSGRVGVQWRPTEGQNYYASFNRGFKGAAADVGSSAGAVGRPHFAGPETADNYEIGTKQRWLDGRLAWSVTVFDEKIRNVQLTAVNPGTVSSQLLNAGDLLTKGVEGQMQWAVTSDLRFNAAVTYDKATYRGGFVPCNPEQLAGRQGGCNLDNNLDGRPESQSTTGATAMGSPRWKYIVGFDYRHDLSFIGATGSLNVTWSWEDKRPLDQPDRDPLTVEPSHGFLNASYLIVPNGGHWELMIYGRNLTNEFYYNGGTQVDTIIGREVRFIPRDYKIFGGMTLKYHY